MDRANEIAQNLYEMVQYAETQYGIETIATALRDFAKESEEQPPPMKLWTPDEKQLWIAVYAANSDNDDTTSDQLARWADAAVYELRKRYPHPDQGA